LSWSLFKTKCAVLTGPQHISKEQFAFTIADAYHQAVTLHFDTLTAGGVLVNNAPKFPILYQNILTQCNANLLSQSEVHILNQIGPFIQSYWVGLIITGPTGIVNVLSPGTWIGLPIVQNFDFNIILNAMITCFRTHIMTLTGQYTSTVVPGVISPWSGALFQSLP